MIADIDSAHLHGKKFLVGVCGSIAAYKSLLLVRLLVKAGAEVQVIMTPAASQFVGPLSFSTLSKKAVYSTLSSDDSWNNHVALGLWADAMVIAPITATTLSKLRMGMADNVLIATYLSARCPVFFAPAMDVDMWEHGSTVENIAKIEERGDRMIHPEFGELASGLTGLGRMAEPAVIVDFLNDFFGKGQTLKGKRVLINAGSTQEPIDPIRYIGNRSTGKMGLSLAKEAVARGADVQVVLGHVSVPFENLGLDITRVSTAEEMFNATVEIFPQVDIAILAAAVADYRPAVKSEIKIKKKTGSIELELAKTKDIAEHLGSIKKDQQILVGFALETNNEIDYATEKLKRKNLNFIVLNSLQDKGAGLEYDTNKVRFIMTDQNHVEFDLKSKDLVAIDIFDAIENLLES